MAKKPNTYSTAEAADYLGLHPRTFRAYREVGGPLEHLRPFERGPHGKYAYKASDIHQALRAMVKASRAKTLPTNATR